MNNFYKYPEIPLVGRRPEIFAVKEVIATEKLHGTNFRIFFPEGMDSVEDVLYGGRNQVLSEADSENFYGGRPVMWFRQRPELLEQARSFFRERGLFNVIIYGEMIGAGIQKGIRYRSDTELSFRAFDIRIGGNLLTHDRVVEILDAIGWSMVPEVWRGEPSPEAFDALLEAPSLEGNRRGIHDPDNIMEGVVIRSQPLLKTAQGEWLIVKHKAERFAEVQRSPRRRKPVSAVETFARSHVLRGRLLNVLGHLRDAGTQLSGSMADLRHLAPAVVADLRKECGPQLQELLDEGFEEKEIHSAVHRVTQSIYRTMLREDVSRDS